MKNTEVDSDDENFYLINRAQDKTVVYVIDKHELIVSDTIISEAPAQNFCAGSKGSFYYINGENGIVPTEKVKPIDTTGAGDAFFGTFLATLEGKEWTDENLVLALKTANEAGAKTTQFLGAVKFD
jgi:fructose-1-phosphate kinase PfkB-like protein